MEDRNNKILNMYFVKNIKPIDIAKQFNISKSTVTRVLQKDSRYITIKQERKKENQQKHKKYTKDYNRNKRKNIQHKNNADYLILKNMHNQASMEMSKHKLLNNIAYRNWNKSAFNYNKKRKRFEFKNELGRSYNVPKYIRAEV